MEIKNTSQWSTPFVAALMRWLMLQLNHPKPRRKTLRLFLRDSAKQHATGCAHRNANRITASARRRGIARQWLARDNRFDYAPEHPLRNDLEAFVFLMAHELRHLNPDNWRGLSRQGREHDANHAAGKAVQAFRDGGWAEIRCAMREQRRQQRIARHAKAARDAERKAQRNSPLHRLALVQGKRARLERKVKALQTRIARYRRSERALERSIARKGTGATFTPRVKTPKPRPERNPFALTPREAEVLLEGLSDPYRIAAHLDREDEAAVIATVCERIGRRVKAGFLPALLDTNERAVLLDAAETGDEIPRKVYPRLARRIAALWPDTTEASPRAGQ